MQINEVRGQKQALLNGVDLPLPGLGVADGALVYNGQAWDCMSSSEQLKVATAIVRRLNPECGFVLMDKLEQMDADTMREFGVWLEGEGLQVIATRVSSSGEDCTIVIEDGMVAEGGRPHPSQPSAVPPERCATPAAAPKGEGSRSANGTFEMGVF